MITEHQVKQITGLVEDRRELRRALDGECLSVAYRSRYATCEGDPLYSNFYSNIKAGWLTPHIQNRIDEIGKELAALGYVEDQK